MPDTDATPPASQGKLDSRLLLARRKVRLGAYVSLAPLGPWFAMVMEKSTREPTGGWVGALK